MSVPPSKNSSLNPSEADDPPASTGGSSSAGPLNHAYSSAIQMLLQYDRGMMHQHSILIHAAEQGDAQIVSALIDQGADLQADGLKALFVAVHQGHEEVVKILISAGVKLQNQHGNLLFSAIRLKNLSLIYLILTAHTSIEILDESGKSVLMCAAEHGLTDFAHYLLQKGARLDRRDSRGNTALMLAAHRNHLDTVDLFTSLFLHCDAQAQGLQESLFSAILGNALHVLEALILAGADPNKVDRHGIPALHRAIENGRKEIVTILLRKGADYQAQTQDGFTPLMYAAWKGDCDTIKSLLALGVDPNIRNIMGGTAVFWAAEAGKSEAVSILIGAGANLLIINKMGHNPQTWAQAHKHYSVAYMIHSAMVAQIYSKLNSAISMEEVPALIALQNKHLITKSEVVTYLIETKGEPLSKRLVLERAIARDERGRPSNPLSLYVHSPQLTGFSRVFLNDQSVCKLINIISEAIEKLPSHLNRLEGFTPF